ncbi:uncharacterized protein METZ01_LOCUS202813 [marine metagenome]|uniref:Uncharacterized protein n=1 Tax=marine metagenome TaxID=408172 RepID=A0A382EHS1_9ZZZZ
MISDELLSRLVSKFQLNLGRKSWSLLTNRNDLPLSFPSRVVLSGK